MTIDSKDSRYYDNIDLGFTYTKKGEEPVPCYSFHYVKAFALPEMSKRATPIQRQISCNIQNDKKLRVNANIYSI